MYFCLPSGRFFVGEKAQILQTWKIQECLHAFLCIAKIYQSEYSKKNVTISIFGGEQLENVREGIRIPKKEGFLTSFSSMPISLIYPTESMPCCPAFPLIMPCHPRHPHHLRPPQKKNTMAQSAIWSEPCCLPRFYDIFLGSKRKTNKPNSPELPERKSLCFLKLCFFYRSQHPTPFWKKKSTQLRISTDFLLLFLVFIFIIATQSLRDANCQKETAM